MRRSGATVRIRGRLGRPSGRLGWKRRRSGAEGAERGVCRASRSNARGSAREGNRRGHGPGSLRRDGPGAQRTSDLAVVRMVRRRAAGTARSFHVRDRRVGARIRACLDQRPAYPEHGLQRQQHNRERPPSPHPAPAAYREVRVLPRRGLPGRQTRRALLPAMQDGGRGRHVTSLARGNLHDFRER